MTDAEKAGVLLTEDSATETSADKKSEESGDSAAEKTPVEELSADEKERRLVQSITDRVHAQYKSAIDDMRMELAELKSGNGTASQDDNDLDALLQESEVGSDPVIQRLVREHKELKTELKQRREYEASSASETLLKDVQEFFAENKSVLNMSKTEIASAWLEDLNDRLAPYKVDFDKVMALARAGKPINPEFAKVFSAKLRTSLNVVKPAAKASDKKADSDKRIEERKDILSGSNVTDTDTAATDKGLQGKSYRELKDEIRRHARAG